MPPRSHTAAVVVHGGTHTMRRSNPVGSTNAGAGRPSTLLLLLVQCTVPEAADAFACLALLKQPPAIKSVDFPERDAPHRHRGDRSTSAAMKLPLRGGLRAPGCPSRLVMGNVNPRRYMLGMRSASDDEGRVVDTRSTAKRENAGVFMRDDYVAKKQRCDGDSGLVGRIIARAGGGGRGGRGRGGGGMKSGEDGMGWLREFGNGKADAVGLVLSTVLLMTAVAPIGSAADFPAAERSLERTVPLDQSIRLPEIWNKVLTSSTAPVQPLGLPGVLGKNGGRVQALQWGNVQPTGSSAGVEGAVDEVGSEEVSSEGGGTMTEIAGDMVSAARGVAGRKADTVSRPDMKDRHIDTPPTATATTTGTGKLSTGGEENQATTNFKTDSRSSPSSDTTIAPELGTEATGANDNDGDGISGGDSERWRDMASVAQRELLEKLESEHASLFEESLPVPTFSESFSRTLRASLPALMPPLMTVFILVSMPVVALLLKGIGTTLVAIVKGYGHEDRFDFYSYEEDGGPLGGNALEVGFGSSDDGGKRKLGGRGQESAGSAFGMLFGGSSGGQGDGEGGSGEGINAVATAPVGATRESSDGLAHASFPTVHVQTERKGFFDKNRPDLKVNGDTTHVVTDDAMAAMAMATMTQELDQMKRSLQHEVNILKQDLEEASSDSRRLTDKLCRLERENRQLGAVVSRLGGNDAQLLKTQLFSLLSSSSPPAGELGEGSPPQLAFA